MYGGTGPAICAQNEGPGRHDATVTGAEGITMRDEAGGVVNPYAKVPVSTCKSIARSSQLERNGSMVLMAAAPQAHIFWPPTKRNRPQKSVASPPEMTNATDWTTTRFGMAIVYCPNKGQLKTRP